MSRGALNLLAVFTLLPCVGWALTRPAVLALTAAAALPVAVVGTVRWRRRARRRRTPDLCAACEYDLRATPGRCPECGRVPPEAIPV